MLKKDIEEQVIPCWRESAEIVKNDEKPDAERLEACMRMRGLKDHLSHPPDDYLPGGSLHGHPEEIVLSGWSADFQIAIDTEKELRGRRGARPASTAAQP